MPTVFVAAYGAYPYEKEKLMFASGFIVFGAALACAWGIMMVRQSEDESDVPRISKETASSLLEAREATFLDVRTGDAWEKSDKKITGAVREDPSSPDDWAEKYEGNGTLVLYCS